jgi:F-type H+-transporting ATPase subunit b
MKKTASLGFLVVIFIIVSHGYAEELAHHEALQHIPKTVGYQAFNFFGLVIILAFVLRTRVADFFTGRHDKLVQAVTEARRVQEEAARKHQDYQVRLQTLERQAEAQIENIRREGEEYRKRLIEEARLVAKNIGTEAERTAKAETEKAKAALREEVLQQALGLARQSLKTSVVEKDQQRLQKEFVEKIQVVQ